MFDLDNIEEIWATIKRNRTRSFFTAFGVFWGMLMLMVMLGFGLSLERNMLNQWGDTSANAIFFFGGETTMPYKGFKQGRSISLEKSDLAEAKAKFSEIEHCSPVIWWWAKRLQHADKAVSDNNTMVMGLSAEMNAINPVRLTEGRFLNNIDVETGRKVCVIGSKLKNTLFGADKAAGEILWINGAPYIVIGVMEKQADVTIFGDPEESVYAPYSTVAQSSNRGDKLDCICFAIEKDVDINDFDERFKAFLKERHSVCPDDTKGIDSFNTKQFFDTFNSLFTGINILVWIVGIGTLLAGIVGISNIMLVTVKERTQEIGIRRALGASPFTIIRQIMSESLVLSLIAGLGGIVAGVLISMVADSVVAAMPEDEQMFDGVYVPFGTAIGVLGILVVCGLLSGLLPAHRAIKIKAVEALQEE